MDFQGSAIVTTISLVAIILISLSVHEFAHALVANLFGDPTAKLEGRLTLNPVAHWDSVGTTLLVLLLVLNGLGLRMPVFGWGKPVPVNEDNFENPRFHGLQVALAGPMSNLLLAFVLALIIKFYGQSSLLNSVLVTAIYVNVFLMFFNLLPIPPLDGSRVLRLFVSERTYYAVASNPIYLFGAVMLLVFFFADVIVSLSDQLVRLLLRI